MFCKFKNIFGKPNHGIRKQLRLFNISLIDLAAAVLVAYIIHDSFFLTTAFWKILIATLAFGTFAHRIFCVRTTVDKFLFP